MTVHVTNTGVSQKAVFVDARLTELVTLPVFYAGRGALAVRRAAWQEWSGG